MVIRKAVFVRSAYNYDSQEASDESGLECRDKSLTQQSQAAEADINEIVRRFNVTGKLPDNIRVPTFEDWDGVFDFRSAQDQLIAARADFMSLPAQVRSRFDNDPQRFLEFCAEPSNLPAMVDMGLAVKRAATEVAASDSGAVAPSGPA